MSYHASLATLNAFSQEFKDTLSFEAAPHRVLVGEPMRYNGVSGDKVFM